MRPTCIRFAAVPLLGILALFAPARADEPPNGADPQAVQEVLAGKRSEANAAWWGFNPDDATDSLQAAINSGAKRVVIPNMASDWNVRPIKLASDQELVLEKGVVITAKRGEYQGGGDSVLTARDVSNLTIRGYGATVRMHKEDYIVGRHYARFGGIDFVNLTVADAHDRPVIASERGLHAIEMFDITGTITVRSSHPPKAALGESQHSITFTLEAAPASRRNH